MLLTEPPPIARAMKAASAESGMEKNTATVARMLPEKNQNHDGGQQQSDAALMQQRLNGRFDKYRLVEYYFA